VARGIVHDLHASFRVRARPAILRFSARLLKPRVLREENGGIEITPVVPQRPRLRVFYDTLEKTSFRFHAT
jgi:hypothetical protein